MLGFVADEFFFYASLSLVGFDISEIVVVVVFYDFFYKENGV